MLALVAGASMPFAFAPSSYVLLAVFAYALLFWLLDHSQSQKQAALHGFIFGLGWFAGGAWWLLQTLMVFGDLGFAAALAVILLLGAILALFPTLLAMLYHRYCQQAVFRLAGIPAILVATEYLRGHLFTGLPWTSLGTALLDTPLSSWASWLGVYGIAGFIGLAAASILLLSYRQWLLSSVGFTLLSLAALFAPSIMPAHGMQHQVALIQANIPQEQKWDPAFFRETMRRYTQASDKVSAQVDLIIWPEAAMPVFLSRAASWKQWLEQQQEKWQTPLLFGGLRWHAEQQKAQNVLWLYQGQQQDFASKHHLVPFGEYVPAWLPWLHTLVPNIASFIEGSDSGVIALEQQVIGSLICYEDLFPEQASARVAHGATVLVNTTNDAWYGKTPALWQHFQGSRMRAIETGRYVLRVANTGITAVIRPDGSLYASLPWWKQATLISSYRESTSITVYQKWGNWLCWLWFLPYASILIYRRLYD